MTHTDIINKWPSLSDFADDLGIQYGTAKAMRRRGAIPSEYWITATTAADARKLGGVTLEALAAAVARQAEAAR
ncbi:hypothetical protein BKP54_25175 [Ensifer sp. 1H6]|nr:hypothetical protein BKP54_25175 [Ensifer sp. 1H6]